MTFVKIHQMVHLICMYFTLQQFYFKKITNLYHRASLALGPRLPSWGLCTCAHLAAAYHLSVWVVLEHSKALMTDYHEEWHKKLEALESIYPDSFPAQMNIGTSLLTNGLPKYNWTLLTPHSPAGVFCLTWFC